MSIIFTLLSWNKIMLRLSLIHLLMLPSSSCCLCRNISQVSKHICQISLISNIICRILSLILRKIFSQFIIQLLKLIILWKNWRLSLLLISIHLFLRVQLRCFIPYFHVWVWFLKYLLLRLLLFRHVTSLHDPVVLLKWWHTITKLYWLIIWNLTDFVYQRNLSDAVLVLLDWDIWRWYRLNWKGRGSMKLSKFGLVNWLHIVEVEFKFCILFKIKLWRRFWSIRCRYGFDSLIYFFWINYSFCVLALWSHFVFKVNCHFPLYWLIFTFGVCCQTNWNSHHCLWFPRNGLIKKWISISLIFFPINWCQVVVWLLIFHIS